MPDDFSTLAGRTRFSRRKAGISQDRLAELLGASQGTITHIECGRNKETILIVALAKILGVRAEWLATGEGDMLDAWPFNNVLKSDYECLPDNVREEIEQFIRFKIQNLHPIYI